MTDELTKLEQEVRANPGSDKFVELARLLGENPGRRADAREVCFRGLSAQPSNKLGRLLLARLFYLDDMHEFAARELVELAGSENAPSVEKLITEFGAFTLKYLTQTPAGKKQPASGKVDDGVVAELDLDSGFLEALNELEEEDK